MAAYANREYLAIKIKSVYAPVTPKPVSPEAAGKRTAGAFTGDAPWALSALPECFTQVDRVTGPLSYVLRHLPKGAATVPPGTTVANADCRVFSQEGAVWVWRGTDRLRVPPPATLYRTGSAEQRLLALLQRTGSGYDLRIYDFVQ